MTTKNKTLSRILTLTLAFVLVFTGMGIGSWGVDEAWADGLWDGVYQFEVYVDGTKYDVMKIGGSPGVLVPEGTAQIQIKQIQGFPAMLCNKDGYGLYDETNEEAKNNFYDDMFFDKLEVGNYYEGSFTLPLSAFEEFSLKDYPYKISLSTAEGTGCELYVGFSRSNNSIPTLRENTNSETILYLKSGSAFTVPLDGIFQDADGDALAYKVKVGDDGSYTTLNGKTYSGTYDGTETVLYFKANDGTVDSEDVYTVYLKNNTITSKDLSEVIENAPKTERDENYYHTDDRFNGRLTSVNGFWNDMQAALTEAKALFTNNDVQQGLKADVTEEQIAAAYTKLNSSMDALLPKIQANTTTLYEAIKESEKFDASLSYNADNLTTFNEKQSAAKELLSSLFENGKATDANKPDKQEDINKAASELKASYSNDKMTVEISTQEVLTNFLTKAGSGIKGRLLNDLALTGYEKVASFSGEIDGNGHTITVDSAYPGLVGTNNGTIRNLTVDGADLVSVSAICRINKGLIENCHNAANFSNDANNNIKQKGAICNTNDTTGMIRSCYNTGKLSGTYVGGICGSNYGLIENCFNTGLITAESNAGGIAWQNHNGIMASEHKLGTIRGCYNLNLMHHNEGWRVLFGSYMDNILGAIVGDNGAGSTYLGTVEDSYYLDCFVKNKAYGSTITLPLSELYLARYIYKTGKIGAVDADDAVYSLAGWRVKDKSQQTFILDQEYYLYYDKTNEHFIAVTFDENAKSNVIDAAKPSDRKETFSPSYGVYGQEGSSFDRDVYLVTVPVGSTFVKFENTEKIIDYANGYNNKYVNAYRMTDNATMYADVPSSRLFAGTAIDADNLEAIRAAAKSICADDAQTAALIDSMLEGVDLEKKPASSGDDGKTINVKFRLVGATKSTSGNYDVGTNCIDSQYVTWIATRTYAMKEGSSVGDLLKTAIKESGMGSQGEANNYVSGMYAPTVLGHYYLGEFTNGTRSGWMYTVNGKHPSVGLNGYILENNDSVIWHYINDYSYECSDWFDDPDYPNLGNASTWDPWLKVPDVDPTKDTPTVGGAQTEEVKDVTTSGAAGSATTTAPTDVKVSEKTNADGTKEAVAKVKVDEKHHDEIIKQAEANKSAEIILEVSASNTKGADSVQLELDVKFVKNVSEKTDADLTVNTENGKVTLDQETIKTVLSEAKGATITLEVTKVSNPTEAQKKAVGENGHVINLTVKSGDKTISQFNGGKAKVLVEIVGKLLDKTVAAIHIADDGTIEQLAGRVLTIGAKKYYEFTTPHFSTFALVDADELGLEVKEEPTVDAKALIAKLTPVARSAKTAKKNVKVTTSLDKQDKAIIKELKDAGYTVKYRFYRSTKKAAGYKAAVTKKTTTYTNTSGKKGTKYYYKVQIRVYDANGKLAAATALKQCKYASRTWSKAK